jgi:hypothetical protein
LETTGAHDKADRDKFPPSEELQADQLNVQQPGYMGTREADLLNTPSAGPAEQSVEVGQEGATGLDTEQAHEAPDDVHNEHQVSESTRHVPIHVAGDWIGAGGDNVVGLDCCTSNPSPELVSQDNGAHTTQDSGLHFEMRENVTNGSVLVEGDKDAGLANAQICDPEFEYGTRGCATANAEQEGHDASTYVGSRAAFSQATQSAENAVFLPHEDGRGTDQVQDASAAGFPQSGTWATPRSSISGTKKADHQVSGMNTAAPLAAQTTCPARPSAPNIHIEAEQLPLPLAGEPNFLPPFANVENKALNREIQVGLFILYVDISHGDNSNGKHLQHGRRASAAGYLLSSELWLYIKSHVVCLVCSFVRYIQLMHHRQKLLQNHVTT